MVGAGVVLVAGALVAGMLEAGGDPLVPIVLVVLLVIILAFAWRPLSRLVLHFAAVRVLRANGLLQVETVWVISEAGLRGAQSNAENWIPWASVARWREGEVGFTIAVPAGALMIPKRCLTPAQMQEVRSAIARAGVPNWWRHGSTRRPDPPSTIPSFERPAPGPRSVSFSLTLAEVRVASRGQIAAAFVSWGTLVCVVAATVACALWFDLAGDAASLLKALGIGAAATTAVRLVLPLAAGWYQVGRVYGAQPDRFRDNHITWDAEGFAVVSATVTYRKQWAEVSRARSRRGLLLFAFPFGRLQVVPERALDAGQLTDIRICASLPSPRGGD